MIANKKAKRLKNNKKDKYKKQKVHKKILMNTFPSFHSRMLFSEGASYEST